MRLWVEEFMRDKALDTVQRERYKSVREIWIGPNTQDSGRAWALYEMFEPDARWQAVRGRIDVFQFPILTLHYVPLDRLRQAVDLLQRDDISIAVECGGLRDHGDIGEAGERCGEATAEATLRAVTKITEAGGRLEYLALGAPFRHTLATGRPNRCQFTLGEATRELMDFIREVRKVYPDVKMGLIEAVSWYTVGEHPSHVGPEMTTGDLPELLTHVTESLEAVGERLAFYRADYPYDYADTEALDGWGKLKALEDFVRGLGLRFQLIYNSASGGRSSDRDFFRDTVEYFVKYAAVGGAPDDIVIQSWYPQHPQKLVPEDEPFSLTYVVKTILGLIDSEGS